MTDDDRAVAAEGPPESAVQEEAAASAETNGKVTMLTADEILERAPKDLREKVVEIPAWDGSVKIRTLTAAERARIRQIGILAVDAGNSLAEMEIQQFLAGVIEPKFNEHQVRKLHQNSGEGFSEVIAAHDELSLMNKEELAEVRKQFPTPAERDEVPVRAGGEPVDDGVPDAALDERP